MMTLKSRTLIIFICLLLAGCAAVAVLQFSYSRDLPTIIFSAPRQLNRQNPLHIEVRGRGPMIPGKNLDIHAVQGGAGHRLTPRASTFNEENGTLSLTIFLADQPGLRDGEIAIEISARNMPGVLPGAFFAPWVKRSFTVRADLSEPSAEAVFSPTALTRGGAALLTLTPSEELSRLEIGQRGFRYRALRVAGGSYAALAAFPQDLPPEDFNLSLHLVDATGNASTLKISPRFEDFSFRDDLIRLNDAFFKNKYQEFKTYTGKDASPLELFLLMNRDVRKNSYHYLSALCAGGRPEKLWQGAFLEMPGATRRSEFADRRDYIYRGAIIDHQVHLGLDYASVAKDKIPAANSGLVAFTGYLGIHGNAVLIDHGLGLFSLYSHLSSIEVEEGQRVEKGLIIGRTGSTGMSGGDHLHFEILVNGISVNPDFFFNAEWFEQNIDKPLVKLLEPANE